MTAPDGMRLRVWGRAAVSDYLGDFIVYRSFDPVDPRLPRLAELSREAGLDGSVPRKHEPAYARLAALLLRRARQVERPGAALRRLALVGDTRLSDAGAFEQICAEGGWQGLAFIASETGAPPHVAESATAAPGADLLTANRWGLLPELERRWRERGWAVDETTVLVIDLDKTALGARGRNAGVIDAARVEAVRQTVAGLLGDSFIPAEFQAAYERLNQPQFHAFTADNQDYLAYICLAVGALGVPLEAVIGRVQCGGLTCFEQFIEEIEAAGGLPGGLAEVHASIYAAVRAGDPTPFKAFRRTEYQTTSRRMGCLPDDAPLEKLLNEEILLTEEVRRLALGWRARGALVFGLSDKPDEAARPPRSGGRPAVGGLPLHRLSTHSVGTGTVGTDPTLEEPL